MSDQESYRLSVRFGEEILARGHTAIPNLVLNYYVQLGISGAELLFTIHVWQHWWSDRDPYPSLRTIASRMGISVRQAKRHVESLESKGLLRVIERFLPDGSQTTNEFDYSALIRAVVNAARADGALEPGGSAPAIRRRERTRHGPGDMADTPPQDIAVMPTDGAAVIPAPAMAGARPRAAASPKEDAPKSDETDQDGEGPDDAEGLTDLLDLFNAATKRPARTEERQALAELITRYAPPAKRARPAARGEEWVAAALAEVAQAQGPAFDLDALVPVLDRYAVPPKAPAAAPAAPAPTANTRKRQPALVCQAPALADVWRTALEDLREQMAPTNYARWLARTQLLQQAGGEAVVGVPDQVSADQLARRFDSLVRRALTDACGETVTVRYEVAS